MEIFQVLEAIADETAVQFVQEAGGGVYVENQGVASGERSAFRHGLQGFLAHHNSLPYGVALEMCQVCRQMEEKVVFVAECSVLINYC